ncbi:hypothetical protein [Chishuiella sp.]|uniref:hypothetical protein n=1 Tax=Chishuiella sp. TaxID=1969467 RepID=UPI0028B0DE83|nr:hypothetical protein [Chishuiella sp.]
MSKPYKPRNPYSNSSYSKRRRREETQRQIQELKDNGNWNENEANFGGCLIAAIALGIVMLFILIISGPDGLLKWMLH